MQLQEFEINVPALPSPGLYQDLDFLHWPRLRYCPSKCLIILVRQLKSIYTCIFASWQFHVFENLKTFEGENIILCTEYCVRMKKTRAEIISFPLPISHFREKKDNSVVEKF